MATYSIIASWQLLCKLVQCFFRITILKSKSQVAARSEYQSIRLLVYVAVLTYVALCIRVESGSDDPDNLGHLGHFFGGSSGSHPQAKLSGCDPDITCSLENSAGIW